ncbi:MAG: alpha/beta fold hydrolase [Streptosporangiaceae bacterium]|jgi:pimeloyl-ACP methyl ester carboxylesterase
MLTEPSRGTRVLATPDGRQLEVLDAGPDDGLPLIFHNGTPGGLVAFPAMVAEAAARGLRTVLYARPGYGESTGQPGRRVADAAADVTAVLDGLGARQFLTVGWSGGGPHALACAALLPGRCLAAASLAGVAPARARDLDWVAGMGPENVAEFTAAGQGGAALTAFLGEAAAGLGQVTGPQVAEELGGLIAAADRAVVTAEFADYLAGSFRAALRGGIAGWRDDDIAFVSDWGFPVDQAGTIPVAIWQGDEDRMVPFSHGAWLAAHIPGARAHLAPGEGHLTLAARSFGAVLDDLLDLAGQPSAGRARGALRPPSAELLRPL